MRLREFVGGEREVGDGVNRFKKLISLILIIALMQFVIGNFAFAAVKELRLTTITAGYGKTESYSFFVLNYYKNANIFYLTSLKRLIVELKNVDLNNSVSKEMQKKVANLRVKSKYLTYSKIIVFNSSKKIARIILDIKIGIKYKVVNQNGRITIRIFKPVSVTATPKPTLKPTPTPKPTLKPTATPKPTLKPTLTPKPTLKPTPTPTLKPTPKPTPTPTPTPKPKPIVVVSIAPNTTPACSVNAITDATGTNFQIPSSKMAQVNYSRTYLSDGSGVIKIDFSGLDSRLVPVVSGSIPSDVVPSCISLTPNRSNLTLNLSNWSKNLIATKKTNSLSMKISDSNILKTVYNSVLRKAEFRMNLNVGAEFSSELSHDSSIFVLSGPVQEFDIGDGELLPNDGIVSKIKSELSEDGTIRILTITGVGPLVFNLYDSPTSKFTLINIFTAAAKSEKLVILDAGHGGFDPGAVGSWSDSKYNYKLYESKINLDIILRLDKLLTDAGIRVELSRYNDSHVTLSERYMFANEKKATLFLSVHQNASTSFLARGTETYYFSNKGATSGLTDYQFAQNVQNALVKGLTRNTPDQNRGTFSKSYAVIRETKMTAVLAEIEFISNSFDRTMILKADMRQTVAQVLCEATIKSLNMIK